MKSKKKAGKRVTRPLKMHASMRLTVAEANAILAWAQPENEPDKAKRAAMERGIDKLQRAIQQAHKPFKGYVNPALAEHRETQQKIADARRTEPTVGSSGDFKIIGGEYKVSVVSKPDAGMKVERVVLTPQQMKKFTIKRLPSFWVLKKKL